MPTAIKIIALLFLSLLPLPLGYACGKLASKFELNQCYTSVLEHVLTTSNLLGKVPDHFDSEYARFTHALPIFGSETNCIQLLQAVENFQPKHFEPTPAAPDSETINPDGKGAPQ